MFPTLNVNGFTLGLMLAFVFALGVAFGYGVFKGDATAIFRVATRQLRKQEAKGRVDAQPAAAREARARLAITLVFLITAATSGIGGAFLSNAGQSRAGAAFSGVAAAMTLGALLVLDRSSARSPKA